MGIAVSDVNADGRCDLFVTNFYHETNNLHLAIGNGLFEDGISGSGLADPGYRSEGWGVQFLDADLDTNPDLFVANGHLENFSPVASGKMQPHLFRNDHGNFTMCDPGETSPYLLGAYFGRSVVVTDWNRDGRPDLGVTHVDTPTALLTNVTANPGHYLALRLIGTTSARDAIGAVVEVAFSGRKTSHVLTAGDGYACSNERVLIIGLGEAEKVQSLTVRWPGGNTQSVDRVAVDTEMIIVQDKLCFSVPDRPTP